MTATALAPALREAAQRTGQRALVRRIRTGDEWLSWWVTEPRQRTVLLSLLGGLGVMLALVGIAGMTAYTVARRTREIGVRMAFGATAGAVVRGFVAAAAVPIGLGLIVGILGASLATRIIASFLFETTPTDPMMFAGAAVTFGAGAAVAAWLPARRAARVDPVVALRNE
jgi:ABC-type antimicrobial peptide transport system permease subunit